MREQALVPSERGTIDTGVHSPLVHCSGASAAPNRSTDVERRHR